jgi:hypothetical protein
MLPIFKKFTEKKYKSMLTLKNAITLIALIDHLMSILALLADRGGLPGAASDPAPVAENWDSEGKRPLQRLLQRLNIKD